MNKEIKPIKPVKVRNDTRSTTQDESLNKAKKLVESLKLLKDNLKQMNGFAKTLESSLKSDEMDKSTLEEIMEVVKDVQTELFVLTQSISTNRKAASENLQTQRKLNPSRVVRLTVRDGYKLSLKGRYYTANPDGSLSEDKLTVTNAPEEGVDPV